VTTDHHVLDDFGVDVSFAKEEVVLRIRGEVDLGSAPEFGAVVDAIIDRGHRIVLLDLADLAFIDSQGLAVMARAVHRLEREGGELGVRSPSPLLLLLLETTGLDAVVHLDPSASTPEQGPEQSVGTPGMLGDTGQPDPTLMLAAIPARNDLVDSALRVVVSLAQTLIKRAGGTSVSLRRHGRLMTVVASDQTVAAMDDDQYATGEGPCVAASFEGCRFEIDSVAEETRWSAFAPRALALGIHAILSTPLFARDRPIGALNFYSRTVGAFSPKDLKLASMLAAESSTVLTDADLDADEGELTIGLGEALRTREVIAQAQGVVMERDGLSAVTSYTKLRTMAQRDNYSLPQCAQEVVASTDRRHRTVGVHSGSHGHDG
jgi:anti-anti-sigma factor